MAHPNLDRLLEYLLPFAQQMLKKRGEFCPFAASIRVNGELHPIAVQSEDEQPAPTEIIDQLTDILKMLAGNGDIEAGAICYDGRVSVEGGVKRDAITVFLEHSNGECVTIYLPYTKRLLMGYQFGDIIGAKAAPKIFA